MAIPKAEMSIIDPGAMTARLSLEEPVTTPDGQGGASVTWEPVMPLWVRVDPVAAPVEERAGAEVFTVTHRLWLSHRSDIEAGMRFRRGTRRFVIKAWRDPDESGRYLVCDCVEERR